MGWDTGLHNMLGQNKYPVIARDWETSKACIFEHLKSPCSQPRAENGAVQMRGISMQNQNTTSS